MEGGSEPLKKPNWVKPKQENRPLGIKKSYPKMSTVTKRGISEVPFNIKGCGLHLSQFLSGCVDPFQFLKGLICIS